jgi:hypothetical protein
VKLPEGAAAGLAAEVATHLGTLGKVSQWSEAGAAAGAGAGSGGGSGGGEVLVGFESRAAAEAALMAMNKGVHGRGCTPPLRTSPTTVLSLTVGPAGGQGESLCLLIHAEASLSLSLSLSVSLSLCLSVSLSLTTTSVSHTKNLR